VAYAISVFHTPINLSIYQEKKTYITTMLYTCSAVLYISFNILLIPIYGIYGSAYAMIISNLFYSVIGYFYSRKYYFISFKWNKISTTFFVLSGITIVFIIFSNVHFYWSLFTKIFLLCVFLVVIYKNYYSIMIQVWKNNFSKVNIR
jgi:O-antigen/teichoic acid export membrane protein